MHKDELAKLKDINNSAALRRTLSLDLSGYFADDSIFFFIIEVRQRWAKCYTYVSCRSSKGEREKRQKKLQGAPDCCPAILPGEKESNRLLSHIQDDGGSLPAHRLTATLSIFILGLVFFPLKVQLLAYRNNNNHIFFPGHGEEMQTTSLQIEEKNRLSSSSNNPEAGGQTMLKPSS